MKKIKLLVYSLIACLSLSMQSCLFSEEDVFDASSAQRAIASVNECREILEGAANGWSMTYYTGTNAKDGGSNLFARFNGQNVTLASEVATRNYAMGTEVSSLYKVVSFQGTELSFDGYNELIHSFCEPKGYNDSDATADYEFIVRSITKEKIVLTGKKYRTTLVMTPLPEGVDWKTELTKIVTLAKSSPFTSLNLLINGKEVTRIGRKKRAFTISKTDNQGQVTVTSYPFIYTADGVEMYEPFVMDGVTMQHFRWDQKELSFVCTDEGVDAKIAIYTPPGYAKYIGNYTLKSTGSPIECSLKQKLVGSTYSMELTIGATPIELIFDYNEDTDCIDLLSQVVGKYNGFDLNFYPGGGGYLMPIAGAGFTGKVQTQTPLTITFTYNGNNPAFDTIMFLYVNNGYRLVNSITKPVLEKKAN